MTEFDAKVLELRAVVTPRPFYGRKHEATPEQWAANVEYRNASQARWKAKDPQRAKLVARRAKQRHYKKNAEEIKEKARVRSGEYYSKNKTAILKKLRQKYAESPAICRQRVAARRKTAEFRSEQRSRYAVDLPYRIKKIARVRLRAVIAGRSGWRLVGADAAHVMQHLEQMFLPTMTWGNYGHEWEIDHIFPISRANLADELELAAVCNWRNLQPLLVSDNAKKKDRVTPRAVKLFNDIKRELCRAKEETTSPKWQ